MNAYKLLRVRKDGSLGPLFINKRQRIPIGRWMEAEDHKTKGYAHRPGWHVTSRKYAPHLSVRDRVWMKVKIKQYVSLKRPKSQGGTWFLAKWMKVESLA